MAKRSKSVANTMRILILNWRDTKHPKAGGAEYVTMQHAKAWVLNGHSVTWITSGYKNAPKKEIIDGVYIVRLVGSITIFLVAPFYIFYLFLKGSRFDVVVDEVHGIPFFTPLFLPIPKVVFIHEVAGKIWDVMWPFPINKIGKMLEKMYLFIYKNNLFWTDAQSTVDELVSLGIPQKNCYSIACPITPPHIDIKEKKEKNFTLIFLSRIVKMKGIEDVIQSFYLIKKKIVPATLWIIGSGEEPYLNELKRKIDQLGLTNSVKWFGRVNEQEKYSLLAKAHFLLHASVKEGWGLVVLEAASQGTPTIGYNVAGLRDTILHNETGVLTKENTPESLATEAVSLYKNKSQYAFMQKRGIIHAQSFKWKEVTKQSEMLLQEVTLNKKIIIEK